ncbi:MAG: aspartate kinase [Acidobacteriota bacterium]
MSRRSRSPRRTVVKIGGSLLTEGQDLLDLAQVVASRRAAGEQVLLVTSALRGVTDLIERSLWRAQGSVPTESGEGSPLAAALAWRHGKAAEQINPNDERLATTLEQRIAEVDALIERARRLGLSRENQVRLLSYGERLSAPLVAAALRAAGVDTRSVTSEEIGLRGHGASRAGSCDLVTSRAGVESAARELAQRVLVVTGFYGVREDGQVVLFGRGGSDYSASVLASLLEPSRLELWKDVPGVFTANPKRVAGARLVTEISYDEASALGGYGARILHPYCLQPLRGQAVTAIVVAGHPAQEPSGGTRLVEARRGPVSRVAALAVRAPRTVVRVTGGRFDDESRAAGRMLDELGRDGFPLDAVSVSHDSLCFSIVDDRPYEASRMLRSLNGHKAGKVQVRQFPAWLGVVGDQVATNGHARAAVRETLDSLGIASAIEVLQQDATVLRCRVERDELRPLLRALHGRLFETSG